MCVLYILDSFPCGGIKESNAFQYLAPVPPMREAAYKIELCPFGSQYLLKPNLDKNNQSEWQHAANKHPINTSLELAQTGSWFPPGHKVAMSNAIRGEVWGVKWPRTGNVIWQAEPFLNGQMAAGMWGCVVSDLHGELIATISLSPGH